MEKGDVRGKKKMDSGEEEEEMEIEMLLNDLPHVKSPQLDQYHLLQGNGGSNVPTTLPPATGGSGGYGVIGRPSFYLGHSTSQLLIPEGYSSMLPTPSGTISPVGERELLKEEFGLIQRLGAIHFGNDPSPPETTRIGLTSPFGNGSYAVGESSTGVSVHQFSHGLSNHNHRPVSSNPIASSSSSSSSSQYFSIGAGGGFSDGNSFPIVSSNSQRYSFGSDWANTYLPNSNLGMLHRNLNSTISIAEQHQRLREEQVAAAITDTFAHDYGFSLQRTDAGFIQSRGGRSSRRERFNVDGLPCSIVPCSSIYRTRKYDSLMNLRGGIYFAAKDQQGCRFLQHKIDQGEPEEVKMIFWELIDHVAELMVNPFANYLMQKLFDVCTEEQMLRIITKLTQRPFELVHICKNNHGTRAVQRLIETLHTQQQVDMVMSALRPGYAELIVDINGHHVIQRCLQCLNPEDNKFIFEAAAVHCVHIATDQHGCCAIQRCIACSSGEYRSNLVMKIACNGINLAYDRYGNYAVQFIMDMNVHVANRCLMFQFKGNFVELSKNKFGSNVVEKCLSLWEGSRKSIIQELLATPHFDMFLQDQYANYVIQRALSLKGPLRDLLINAIQPHASALRASPYCKKIFSKPYFKRCTSY